MRLAVSDRTRRCALLVAGRLASPSRAGPFVIARAEVLQASGHRGGRLGNVSGMRSARSRRACPDEQDCAIDKWHSPLLAAPFVFKHVAAMPDVHWGMGATVGSVIATLGAICPAAVGVDIGCGMAAVKTRLDASALQGKLPALRHAIERGIPVGFHQRTEPRPPRPSSSGDPARAARCSVGVGEPEEAALRCGTLGGGNHFIEVTWTDAHVWVLLHSGPASAR